MVEFFLGKREQISIGQEHTYGTGTSPEWVFARNATFEPKNSQQWQEILGSGSDSVYVEEREIGPFSAGGTLTFSPQDWRWLKFVLTNGSANILNTNEGTFWSHYFTTTAMTIAPFTLERAKQKTDTDDHVEKYIGSQIDNATIAWDTGGGAGGALVKVTCDIVTSTVASGTVTSSIAAPTNAAYQFRNVVLTINGSTVVEHKGGTIRIESNLSDGRYANYTQDRFRAEGGVQTKRVSGAFRILTTSANLYNLWQTGTIVNNCNVLFKRGNNDEMLATLNEFRIETNPDPTNLEGINETTIEWTAKNITGTAKDQITRY